MRIKKIALALREAKTSVRTIALFNSAMDTLLVVMLGLLVTKLINITWYWCLPVGIVYALFHTPACLSDASLKNIEKKNPELAEELRTAADNWKKDNEIVSALNEEVLDKMKNVRTGSFLEMGKLTRQISIMALIAFIIVGASAFDVHFIDFGETLQELKDYQPFKEYDINEELLQMEESTNLSEILGDATIIQLGKQQLDLEINPIMDEAKIGSFQDVTERRFREVPPREIRASTDASFEDSVPKEYQKIVKTYFREITK